MTCLAWFMFFIVGAGYQVVDATRRIADPEIAAEFGIKCIEKNATEGASVIDCVLAALRAERSGHGGSTIFTVWQRRGVCLASPGKKAALGRLEYSSYSSFGGDDTCLLIHSSKLENSI